MNIIVNQIGKSKARFEIYNDNKLILKTFALIGQNGITNNKVEGDKKTPIGTFKFGIAFGIHKKSDVEINNSLKYIKLNENLHWVDDVNSSYYNQLVDISKTKRDFNSAEHLL